MDGRIEEEISPGPDCVLGDDPENFKRQLSNFLTAFNFIFLIYFGVSVGYYYLAVPTAIGPFLFLQKEKMATVTLLLRFTFFF
jgi:hypothetical protein